MYERIAPPLDDGEEPIRGRRSADQEPPSSPHLRLWSRVSAEVVKGAGMRAWRQPADGRGEMNDA